MTSDPRVAAVGSLMSCERKVHLQSWAVLLDWRVADIFLESYEASCHTSTRLEAISVGEIGPYEALLARGFAMASVYPAVHYLDQHTPMTSALRATLYGCTNPLGGYNAASKAASDASREANRTMTLPGHRRLAVDLDARVRQVWRRAVAGALLLMCTPSA